MSTKSKKVMTQPINQIFRMLQNQNRVQVQLYQQTQVRMEGVIIGFDEFMNLVLDNAEEINVKTSTRKSLGKTHLYLHIYPCCYICV